MKVWLKVNLFSPGVCSVATTWDERGYPVKRIFSENSHRRSHSATWAWDFWHKGMMSYVLSSNARGIYQDSYSEEWSGEP